MKCTVLAVASAGGHWEQLHIMSAAFEGARVVYVTTKRDLLNQKNIEDGFIVPDCNRNSPISVLKCTWQCAQIVFSVKPQIIISTGAAPGILAMIFGRMVGSKLIWIDSVANVEKLSMSGKIASYFCDICLTQWQHLSSGDRVRFEGAVI